MARLDTSLQDQARFLAVMDCDMTAISQDRDLELLYKLRLSRHTGIHSGQRISTELQRMGGWQ